MVFCTYKLWGALRDGTLHIQGDILFQSFWLFQLYKSITRP